MIKQGDLIEFKQDFPIFNGIIMITLGYRHDLAVFGSGLPQSWTAAHDTYPVTYLVLKTNQSMLHITGHRMGRIGWDWSKNLQKVFS